MLYTRLFVRKRSVFSTKVVFYRLSTCIVIIYISTRCNHSLHLVSIFTNAHYTVCLWVLIKSYICSCLWQDVRRYCQASELQKNVWNVCIYNSCQLDYCTFHSPQIKFALIILTYTASTCDVGDQQDQHLPLDMAFPFNRLCDRVGVYLLLEKIWKSKAIIRSYSTKQCTRYTVLNYEFSLFNKTFF